MKYYDVYEQIGNKCFNSLSKDNISRRMLVPVETPAQYSFELLFRIPYVSDVEHTLTLASTYHALIILSVIKHLQKQTSVTFAFSFYDINNPYANGCNQVHHQFTKKLEFTYEIMDIKATLSKHNIWRYMQSIVSIYKTFGTLQNASWTIDKETQSSVIRRVVTFEDPIPLMNTAQEYSACRPPPFNVTPKEHTGFVYLISPQIPQHRREIIEKSGDSFVEFDPNGDVLQLRENITQQLLYPPKRQENVRN